MSGLSSLGQLGRNNGSAVLSKAHMISFSDVHLNMSNIQHFVDALHTESVSLFDGRKDEIYEAFVSSIVNVSAILKTLPKLGSAGLNVDTFADIEFLSHIGGLNFTDIRDDADIFKNFIMDFWNDAVLCSALDRGRLLMIGLQALRSSDDHSESMRRVAKQIAVNINGFISRAQERHAESNPEYAAKHSPRNDSSRSLPRHQTSLFTLKR